MGKVWKFWFWKFWVVEGCGLSFSLLQKHCFNNIPIITIRSYYKEAITFTPKITLPQTIKFTIIVDDIVWAQFPFDGPIQHLHQKSERGISPNQIKQTKRNNNFLLVADPCQKRTYVEKLSQHVKRHDHHCHVKANRLFSHDGFPRSSSSRFRFSSTT